MTMIDKRIRSCAEAVKDVFDGAAIMVGGFGEAGSPVELLHAIVDQGARELTIISNNAGNGHVGLAALLARGRVRRMICSFPKGSHSHVFAKLYQTGKVELEVVPQGTLAERIRAAGAGIGAFYTRTSVGTILAHGKEVRRIAGKEYVLEYPLFADFSVVKCDRADLAGNLTFNKTARNFAPIMCTAAHTTIAQARSVEPLGTIDPEHVVTCNIFVDRVIEVAEPAHERTLTQVAARYQ